MMDILQEVKRMVEAAVAPIKMLPIDFQGPYAQGQIDMADTIIKLIEVAQNKEGIAIAKAHNEPTGQ